MPNHVLAQVQLLSFKAENTAEIFLNALAKHDFLGVAVVYAPSNATLPYVHTYIQCFVMCGGEIFIADRCETHLLKTYQVDVVAK